MSRDLDALVAEKVMGWTEVERISREMSQTDIGPVGWFGRPPLPSTPGQRIPEFSSDIAAAWQVVEKVGDLGLYRFMLTRRLNGTEGWEASWSRWGPDGPTDERGSAHAPTPAMAICLAALEALGVPLPETP